MNLESNEKNNCDQEKNTLHRCPDASNEHNELIEIKASQIVNRYILWSLGAGAIPLPILDVSVLSFVQLKMLKELSHNYGIPFSKTAVKSSVAILIGFLTARSLQGIFFQNVLKWIPVIGFMGYISMPIYSAAITYAIGKIFVQHFESGGTFLTFKPYKVKEHFAELFKEGQIVVSNLNKTQNNEK